MVTPLGRLLEAFYRPSGHRLGILVSHGCAPSVAAAASAVLESRGMRPERRLCRLRPRPGEQTLRPADVADFLVRFGAEYSVAVLSPADPAGEPLAGLDVLAGAARSAGCALGWLPGVWPEDAERRLAALGVDFAVGAGPGGGGVGADVGVDVAWVRG